MKILNTNEIGKVTGGNALDTTTGSFVPSSGQSFSDCFSSTSAAIFNAGGTPDAFDVGVDCLIKTF